MNFTEEKVLDVSDPKKSQLPTLWVKVTSTIWGAAEIVVQNPNRAIVVIILLLVFIVFLAWAITTGTTGAGVWIGVKTNLL